MSHNRKLLLFMTPGVGLNTWQDNGTYNREIKFYLEYLKRGWEVTIASFEESISGSKSVDGIQVISCPHRYLLFLLPFVLRKFIKNVDILKTNQSWRCWWYVIAARLLNKPILLRCGWLPGRSFEIRNGLSLGLRIYQLKEAWAFRNADLIEVATEEDKEWASKNYNLPLEKIHVLPNFIDIDLFRPLKIDSEPRTLVFVGRLTEVKNIPLLIDACSRVGISKLTLIGEGELKTDLILYAKEQDVKVEILGRKKQEELPELLQKSSIFVLPSRAEGHPKVLLEAMACGMPCIGTKVPGIQNVIKHFETGILVESSVDSMANGIEQLFEDRELARRLGLAARTYIEENLTFNKVFSQEFELIDSLLT
ncbi:MAG: glycosyltransferase family 4 protein [Bdellovibrionota bacterium]